MNTHTVKLPYDNDYYLLDIPGSLFQGEYKPIDSDTTVDETEILQSAIKNPIGSPPLKEIVKKGVKVVIVTSDISRPCPSGKLLPFVLEELGTAGIPDEDITIVIGLGLHRSMTAEEINQAVSPQIAGHYKVINHDARNTLYVGVTSAGTPVELFRPVVEADTRICLGNLEFHYFAGYSGGAKAIFPGVASRTSVTANHAMMTREQATAGHIVNNPVRTDIEEAAAMVGVDFILNVIVNESHRIVAAFAGEVTAAHRAGCELVAKRGMVHIPRKAEIVIASAGGYPKDINFYQAHKALEGAKYFVRPGGIIILVAGCTEGIGNQVFEEWLLKSDSPDHIITKIQQEFVLGGHKAAAIALILKKAKIFLVSKMPGGVVRRAGMQPFSTPQQALESALHELVNQPEIIVLPQAGSLIPGLVDG